MKKNMKHLQKRTDIKYISKEDRQQIDVILN